MLNSRASSPGSPNHLVMLVHVSNLLRLSTPQFLPLVGGVSNDACYLVYENICENLNHFVEST